MRNLYPEINPQLTYKQYRELRNPWGEHNTIFIGNLNPDDDIDVNIIDEVHSIIDHYYEPRYLGVQDIDRFDYLFHIRLRAVENKFYKSLMLDNNYPELKDILNNMQLLNNSEGNGNIQDSETSTRTDNLNENIEFNADEHITETNTTNNLQDKRTLNYGEETEINTQTNNLSDSREDIYGSQGSTATRTLDTETNRTDALGATEENSTRTDDLTSTSNSSGSTEYGKSETTNLTDTQTGKSRDLISDTPQSNVSASTSGLDTPVTWTYASQLQDHSQNNTDTRNITLTNSGTDKTTSTDTTTNTGTQGTKTTTKAVTNTSDTSESGTITDETNVNQHTDTSTLNRTGTVSTQLDKGAHTTQDNLSKTGTINTTVSDDPHRTTTERINTGTQTKEGTSSRTTHDTNEETLEGRNLKLSELIKEFEDLCFRTVSSYFYLFKSLDDLFYSVWDIDWL